MSDLFECRCDEKNICGRARYRWKVNNEMKLSELYAECEGITAAQKEKMVGIC
jgi:hypothetical protein